MDHQVQRRPPAPCVCQCRGLPAREGEAHGQADPTRRNTAQESDAPQDRGERDVHTNRRTTRSPLTNLHAESSQIAAGSVARHQFQNCEGPQASAIPLDHLPAAVPMDHRPRHGYPAGPELALAPSHLPRTAVPAGIALPTYDAAGRAADDFLLSPTSPSSRSSRRRSACEVGGASRRSGRVERRPYGAVPLLDDRHNDASSLPTASLAARHNDGEAQDIALSAATPRHHRRGGARRSRRPHAGASPGVRGQGSAFDVEPTELAMAMTRDRRTRAGTRPPRRRRGDSCRDDGSTGR